MSDIFRCWRRNRINLYGYFEFYPSKCDKLLYNCRWLRYKTRQSSTSIACFRTFEGNRPSRSPYFRAFLTQVRKSLLTSIPDPSRFTLWARCLTAVSSMAIAGSQTPQELREASHLRSKPVSDQRVFKRNRGVTDPAGA